MSAQIDPVTIRQFEVYRFIQSYRADHGNSPTQREIANGIGIQSSTSVIDALEGLEGAGWIRRQKHKSRAILPTGPDDPDPREHVRTPDEEAS